MSALLSLPAAMPAAPEVQLRTADVAMDLRRLGSLHQSRLSFVRSLVRAMHCQRWQIDNELFNLDADGYGTVIYAIRAPYATYRFVVFSQYLDPTLRSDRVIAEQWDLACALCEGEISVTQLQELRENIPRQEAGRCTSNVLVLTRANRSTRNFSAVLERLAAGRQPDPDWFAKVGYLYRTTAVYGNGKFGLADFEKVRDQGIFSRPFSAQMLAVYLVRHFSVQQVEHVARMQAPATAVGMDRRLARYLGIGNSTGLGMAPFLLYHPALINQWVQAREQAIARVRAHGCMTQEQLDKCLALLQRAGCYIQQTHTEDSVQKQRNGVAIAQLGQLQVWLGEHCGSSGDGVVSVQWADLLDHAGQYCSFETQEMVNSIALELYPELVDELEDTMAADECHELSPGMSVAALLRLLQQRYDWALEYDFSVPDEQFHFWYKSAEKEEPRLGVRGVDAGESVELPLDIARQAQQCFLCLQAFAAVHPQASTVEFLLAHPEHRAIVVRIQNTGRLVYGEIRTNTLGKSCRPIDLLRCKLAFFGAGKFDPRSDRWVRITLFQGAPLADEIDNEEHDKWFLPLMPSL